MVSYYTDDPNNYINRLIRRKARAIARRRGFTESDVDDLMQKLWLHLLEREHLYDPSRSSFATFADRVIRNKIRDILRARYASRRDPQREAFSLDERIRDAEGISTPIHETISKKDPGVTEFVEYNVDMLWIKAKLSPDAASVMEARLSGLTYTEIAVDLGLSRRKVDKLVKAIKRVLQEYHANEE
jgi:RNA polymerase sigma factor (sigma-70 family)